MDHQTDALALSAGKKSFRLLLATLFATALAVLFATPASAQAPGILAFDLSISGRHLATGLNTNLNTPVLRVRQGQTTALNLTTDEATRIFLQDYGHNIGLAPGAPGTLKFKATVAGRFAVEAHGFAGRQVLADTNGGSEEGNEAVQNALASLADSIVSEIASAGGGAGSSSASASRRDASQGPQIVFIPPTPAQVVLLYIEVLPR